MRGRAIRNGTRLAALAGICVWMAFPSYGQNRGVYPLGMSAINSGLMPASDFTYSNQFLLYTRDEAKDNAGQTLPVTGNQAVILDMNTITWMSKKKSLRAQYAASATLPFSKNDLTSDLHGYLSGGSGFADSYYIPVILGWRWSRAAVRAMYGFLAPTGRFRAGANDNVGSGYWTQTLSSGQTISVTENQRLSLSAFQMYEFHTVQEGTVHFGIPGETVRPGFRFAPACILWRAPRPSSCWAASPVMSSGRHRRGQGPASAWRPLRSVTPSMLSASPCWASFQSERPVWD